jgi:chorismate mutase
MDKNLEFVLEIRKQLDKTIWNFERKEILKKAVAELKKQELNNYQIRELFRAQFSKEQDNSNMVANNARYLELLDEILN